MNCCQLAKVIEAGHILFEFIEKRDWAYKVLRNFIDFRMKKYSNFEKELELLKESIDNWIDYNEEKKEQIKEYVDKIKSLEDEKLLGHLTLLFLLSWNMNRFKDCNNFGVDTLLEFGDYLNEQLQALYKDKKSIFYCKSIQQISWEDVNRFLEELKNILKNRVKDGKSYKCFQTSGKRENEWVGAIKVGSVFFPKVIIPVDNPIAEALCFKYPGQNFSLKIYKEFWESIKKLTKACPDLANKLKKIDELFYVLFSLRDKIKARIQEEFFSKDEGEINKELRRKRSIEKILTCFKDKIKKVDKINNKIMLIIDYDGNGKPIHIGLFDKNGRTSVSIDIGFDKKDFSNSNKGSYVKQIFKNCRLLKSPKDLNGIILGTLEENERKILEKIGCFLEGYHSK